MSSEIVSKHKIRSDETRRQLVGAAIDVLVDEGFGQFSFLKVCTRAGFSRGAIHHHYAAPHDLLAGVVDELYRRMKENVAADLAARGGADHPPSRLVDILWRRFTTAEFRVIVEIRAASASDSLLAVSVANAYERMNGEVVADAVEQYGVEEAVVRIVLGTLTASALNYFTLMAAGRPADAEAYAARFTGWLKEKLEL